MKHSNRLNCLEPDFTLTVPTQNKTLKSNKVWLKSERSLCLCHMIFIYNVRVTVMAVNNGNEYIFTLFEKPFSGRIV